MISVVVVEDSAVQRAHLIRTLEADGDIQVTGQATAADEAVDLVRSMTPDVVMLDLQIPRGGGVHVIEQIMAFNPTPILVLSASVTGRHSQTAVEAMVAGAVDAIPKPDSWDATSEQLLRRQVRVARNVTVVRHPRARLTPQRHAPPQRSPVPPARSALSIVAIAASTGGPAAIAKVLSGLGGISASVVVVQHIHPDFVGGFVEWMARVSAIPVKLAADGERMCPGIAYVAPGGSHLRIGTGGRFVLEPEPGALHCPSADALFRSLAKNGRGSKVGVLLTGMGSDGAEGLLELHQQGGITLAQDEASSAVYGMPRAAKNLGGVSLVVPLERMARAIARSL